MLNTGSLLHTPPLLLLWFEQAFRLAWFWFLLLASNGLETKLGLKGLKVEFPKA